MRQIDGVEMSSCIAEVQDHPRSVYTAREQLLQVVVGNCYIKSATKLNYVRIDYCAVLAN